MDIQTQIRFIETVKKMRKSQKEFFRTKSSIALKESIKLEREVDKMIDDHGKPDIGNQHSIF